MKHRNMMKNFVLVIAVVLFTVTGFRANAQTCPFAKSDFDTTLTGTSVITFVGENDSVGPTPYITILMAPLNGTLSIIDGEHVMYTPDAGFGSVVAANDIYVYQVCDTTPLGCGCASPTLVNIYVMPPPPPPCVPVSADDSLSLVSGDTAVGNILLNDMSDSAVTAVGLLAPALFGSASIDSIGNITYVPDSGFVGADAVSYYVCNSCGCDTATVYFTVSAPPPCNPTAMDDSVTVFANDSTVLMLLTNDSDNGHPITSTGILVAPAFGSLYIDTLGNIIYISDSTFTGTGTAAYYICNDCSCDTAFVYFNVLPPPPCTPIANIDLVNAFINDSMVLDLTGNDIDNANPFLTYGVLLPPAHGTLSVDTLGTFTYLSDSTAGMDSAIYYVCNACGCDTALVYFTVTVPPSCVPTAVNDTVNIFTGDTIVIAVAANDLDNGSPFMGGNIITTPAHGSFTIDMFGNITYIADLAFTGTDTGSYYICNLCGCDTAFVFINITAAPCTLPVANDDTISASYTTSCVTEYNVLGNDVLNGALSSVTIIGGPFNGLGSVDSNGIVSFINFTGIMGDVDVITYVVCNACGCDTANFYLILDRDCFSPPIAVWDTIFGNGNPILIHPENNDSDPDGDSIWVESILVPPLGGTAMITDSGIYYIPYGNHAGVDFFTYVLVDEHGMRDTAIVIIVTLPDAVDDYATTMSGEAVTIDLFANDRVSTSIEVSPCSSPANGTVTIAANGEATYTPNDGFSGVDSFCYIICDSLLGCDTAWAYITIQPYDAMRTPDAFSPNEDGINDHFVVTGIEAYPLSQLIIFNRWGNEVWRSEDGTGYQNDFDGHNQNGTNLPDGTYYYVLLLNDSQVENRSGFLVIRR